MATTAKVTDSNGVVRTVEYQKFDKELRIYRVYGDITDRDALAEVAQILAIENNADTVTLNV